MTWTCSRPPPFVTLFWFFFKASLSAHIIFTFAFVVHLSTIAYDLKYPKYPSIRIRKTELRNIDFPVVFKFCIREDKNPNTFWKMGYKDRFQVFKGSSIFNRSLFGWNGHTKNFSTLMPVKGIRFTKSKYTYYLIYSFLKRNDQICII